LNPHFVTAPEKSWLGGMQVAIERAQRAGVMFIAAAGNEAT